jgi:hypothetical protein
MPRVVRSGQWVGRPAWQVGHTPQAALAHQGQILSPVYHTDELVAQDTMELSVPLHDLQVCVAEAGQCGADSYLTRCRLGDRTVVDQPQLPAAVRLAEKDNGFHRGSLLATIPIDGGSCLLKHDLFQAEGIVGWIPGYRLEDHLLDMVLDELGRHDSSHRNGLYL